MNQLISELKKPKNYLLLFNILFVFLLIILSNLGILPMKNLADFAFFSFLFLFFALYRPGWVFLFFVGTLILENINIVPINFGMAMRPYQFFGALTILAVLVRWLAKRLHFEIIKLKWFDMLLILIAASGFVSSLGAVNKFESFKLTLIFSSFVGLYFLIRNYVRDIDDLKRVIPFFLSSSVIVVLYSVWQNMRFMERLAAYETMPGRPNSTFTEADWLGIFLVFLIAGVYAFIYFKQGSYIKIEENYRWKKFVFPYFFLTIIFIALIISVSRSAWLGAIIETLFFLAILLTGLTLRWKNWQWKTFSFTSIRIFASLILALAVIYFFHLTNFQLFNRVESSGSGLQKITVSCIPGSRSPEKIGVIEELEKFGCRHVNLEDIKKEITEGNSIKEIYRNDPNVYIRKEIYRVAWQEIKTHPIIGIGWGSISNILGKDSRGSGLNASNIFLEIWLGSGIIGLMAFLAVWVYIPFRMINGLYKQISPENKAFSLFIIVAWLGVTVSNLFNSGILLAFIWLFLAISYIEIESNENRH